MRASTSRYLSGRLVAIVFGLCMIASAPVFAQPAPVTLKPGDPVRLAWNYDAASMTARPVQFRLYVDGVVSVNFKSTDLVSTTAAGVMTFTTNAGIVASWTQAQIGTHLYEVTAYDSEGESTTRASLSIEVKYGTPPPGPTGLRPYTVQGQIGADGTITLVLTPQGSTVAAANVIVKGS